MPPESGADPLPGRGREGAANATGMTNPVVTPGAKGQSLESPVPSKGHAGFGGKSGETCREVTRPALRGSYSFGAKNVDLLSVMVFLVSLHETSWANKWYSMARPTPVI